MSDEWLACEGSIELPGRVLALQSSSLDCSVWALVEIERKWWQFWFPPTREKWINVVLPPL